GLRAFLLVERLRTPALRVTGAAEEAAIAVPAHDHRLAALGAVHLLVTGHDLADDLLAPARALVQALLERSPEVLQYAAPFEFAFLDAIELGLHPAREVHGERFGECTNEEASHGLTEWCRLEALLL